MAFTAVFLTFCLSLAGSTPNQEPKSILTTADIDQLINTYKPLMSDLEKLGAKIKNKQDPNLLMGYAASDEAAAIFRRHGWDEAFFKKYGVIAQSYVYLQTEAQIEKMPEQDRGYMRQSLEPYRAALKKQVHDKDLELVRTNFRRLAEFFESLK